jgi:hypothetical protein
VATVEECLNPASRVQGLIPNRDTELETHTRALHTNKNKFLFTMTADPGKNPNPDAGPIVRLPMGLPITAGLWYSQESNQGL